MTLHLCQPHYVDTVSYARRSGKRSLLRTKCWEALRSRASQRESRQLLRTTTGALLNSQDVESIKCIRAELGSVAGGKVPEGLIHEELLKGARALLEPKTVKK